ncbi:hypothetical protein PYW07_000380 [Mythimna separata]|uniref:Uncharacterized protein n=1 Tax=Mythimna separata TaxID=271217 RepID=A0AAD8E0Z0_MYTSE|nr:hypothetical protein PYW07_000380 [Mythimna separata]
MPRKPVVRTMKGLPQDLYSAEGLMYQDWSAVTPCQRACTTRLGIQVQREQEEYLAKHPEILAMLKIFIAKVTKRGKRQDLMAEAARHFTRPFQELDEEVRAFLQSPKEGPYVDQTDRQFTEFDEIGFLGDLGKIIIQHYPPLPWQYHSPAPSLPNTLSSSFLSFQTSELTLPTPEPVKTPELTTSQIFYNVISNTVDKAIYVKVDEGELLYDTYYVELMKAVEEAMEVPVIDIRADIAQLFFEAYHMFEVNIMEKEAFAAEIAWEKRMRKKLKKTLRRQKNFKGYETPPTPKSTISSHESYKRPPPRPCECQPLAYYNRYGKDRFGIYLPSGTKVIKENVTTTPDCVSLLEEAETDAHSHSTKTTSTNQSTAGDKRMKSLC